MMAAETIEISLKAQIADFKRTLVEAGNVTKGEAQKMAISIERSLKKAEKAQKDAARAARRMAKSTADIGGKAEAVKQAMEGMGGSVGAAAGIIEKFGRSMGGVASPIGIATGGVAALGLAAAGTVSGLMSLGRSAVEALDELEGLEGIELSPAAIRQVEGLDQGFQALTASTAEARVELGAAFSSEIRELTLTFTGAAKVAGEYAESLAGLFNTARELGTEFRKIVPVFWLLEGLDIDVFGELQTRGLQADMAISELGDTAEKLEDQLPVRTVEKLANSTSRLAKASRDAAKEEAAFQAAMDDVQASLEEKWAKQAEIKLNIGIALDEKAHDDFMVQMDDAKAEMVGAYEEIEQRAEDAQRKQEEMWEGIRQAAENYTSFVSTQMSSVNSIIGTHTSKNIQLFEDEAARIKDKTAVQIEAVKASVAAGEITQEQADAEIQVLKDLQRQRIRTLRTQARNTHKAAQATAIATATIDSIAAGVSLIPAFAWMGPLAPAGAAAEAGLALAAAITSIKAVSPPSFPTGGIVQPVNTTLADHQMIQAAAGEAVLNRAAVRDIGEEQVRALNQGRGRGGGGVMVMRYRHRDLSVVLQDHMRMDTPLARQMDSMAVPGRAVRK